MAAAGDSDSVFWLQIVCVLSEQRLRGVRIQHGRIFKCDRTGQALRYRAHFPAAPLTPFGTGALGVVFE